MLGHMRTTVRLPDTLLRQAKEHAARTGRTLTSVIEDALRRELQAPQRAGPTERFRAHTVGGKGPRGGVDIDDTAALVDLMEDRDADS